MIEYFTQIWPNIVEGSHEFFYASVFFICLSFFTKKESLLARSRRFYSETRLNITYYCMDILLITSLLIPIMDYIDRSASAHRLISAQGFENLPLWLVIFSAVFISDFIGYWRHRLMHIWIFWPVHAIHHSDRELTWLSLIRFHPVNRLIASGLNIAVLSLIGFPLWAIAINGLLRHFYGYFIHADLPWKYGIFRYVFVSPVMHRWHHVRDITYAGKNFSTIFSFFDLAFGTYYVPQRAITKLGIEQDLPTSWLRQVIHPFQFWLKALVLNPLKSLRLQKGPEPE